ncbi:Ricin B-like lectin euls3 [Ancistrocladus abbreviatus]
MDNPFGHHHHRDHHHHHREENEDYPPPHHPPPTTDYYHPPPSTYPSSYYDQPPPPHRYEAHQPPPPRSALDSPNYPPHSYAQHASHVSYASGEPQPTSENVEEHHHYRPHMPSFTSSHMHSDTDHYQPSEFAKKPSEFARKSAVKVYTKAEPNFSLTIRDGEVILARSDPNDRFQHWIKDEKYSTKVKDEEGCPSFALVNKATGQAMKHSVGGTHPVQLIPYNPDVLDASILWTESKDLGDGFRTIRMVNNIRLNVDALHGDPDHGGVRDGTTIVLWEWMKGDNQRWKIEPY